MLCESQTKLPGSCSLVRGVIMKGKPTVGDEFERQGIPSALVPFQPLTPHQDTSHFAPSYFLIAAKMPFALRP